MLKTTESPNSPQSVSHKNKAKIHPIQEYLAMPTRPLFGPGGNVLSVLGVAKETLCNVNKTATEDIYVVKALHIALLGRRPAIEQLQLVRGVDSNTIESVTQRYLKLCSGLGLLKKCYSIKLKLDAVPFSLHTPRRAPLPLMQKVKEELNRLEKMVVITNQPEEETAD